MPARPSRLTDASPANPMPTTTTLGGPLADARRAFRRNLATSVQLTVPARRLARALGHVRALWRAHRQRQSRARSGARFGRAGISAPPTNRLNEVPHDRRAVRGEDGLGVKLHALDRLSRVAQ